MAISPIKQGSPEYPTQLDVSPGDVDTIKLRSRETAPLSHESLDENFTNLANKINEILGQHIDKITITDIAEAPEPSRYVVDAESLGINNGAGIKYSSSTGVFAHQDRPSAPAGYSTGDLGNSNRRFINAIDFDAFGHVAGFQSGTINFSGGGNISVDQDTFNQVTISSSAYGSGDSPSFSYLKVSNTGPKIQLESTSALHRNWEIAAQEDVDQGFQIGYGNKDSSAGDDAYTAALVIKDTGNVGIGATTPGQMLSIKGDRSGFSISSEDYENIVYMGRRASTQPDLGYFRLRNAATTTVAIDSAGYTYFNGGNVGIGTTSPDYKLEILESSTWNALNIKSSHTSGAGFTLSNSSRWSLISTGETAGAGKNKLGFHLTQAESGSGASSGYKMVINDNGNVGIGTNTPSTKLEIAGNVRINGGEDSGSQLVQWCDNNGHANIAAFDIFFKTGQNQSRTDSMIIDSSGKVGIGTNDPTNTLHVHGSARIERNGHSPLLQFTDQGSSNRWIGIPDGSQKFSIYANDGSTEQLTIDKDGNVGIGTTSLGTYKLNVNGSTNIQGALHADSIFLKSSAYEMWHRSYVVNSNNHGELLTEAGGTLSQGGSYRVTAHIPGTGTHTGASAVFWNSDGTWYVNQTVQPVHSSNHIGFYVSSDNKPTIQTWHTSDYSISVLHERMFLGEAETENTRYLFGMDGLLSYKNDGRLYLNSHDTASGGGNGYKLVNQTSSYAGWDVYKVSSNGFMMAHASTVDTNFWLGANTHYNQDGWKSLKAGRSSWGKFGGSSATDVFALYTDTSAADGGPIQTEGNEMFKVTNTTTYDHGNTNIHAGNIGDYAYTESEINHQLARAHGWASAYGTGDEGATFWDTTEDAVRIYSSSDETSGAAYKAIRVVKGDVVRFTVMVKGNVGSVSGLYLRVYGAEALTEGHTFITSGSRETDGQSVTSDTAVNPYNRTDWLENGAVPSNWTDYTYEYRAHENGYISFNILNWAGHGKNSIYIKDPDIQITASSVGYKANVVFNNTYSGNYDTDDFINELVQHGCFQGNGSSLTLKASWDYAGNRNLYIDANNTIELAGCLIETWSQGTYKHIRVTRPNTGTGGESVWVYNDQGSSYAPGWRQMSTLQASFNSSTGELSLTQ